MEHRTTYLLSVNVAKLNLICDIDCVVDIWSIEHVHSH